MTPETKAAGKEAAQQMREANKLLDTLTGKQRLFVIRYLQHFNATRAAREAGYSPRSCYVQGSQNLAKPRVRSAVDALLRVRGVTAERVICEVAAIAMGIDVADFEPWLNGKKSLQELRREGAPTSGLTSVSESLEGVRSLRMASKTEALKILVGVLGLAEHKTRLSGGEDIGANAPQIQFIFEEVGKEDAKPEQ